MSEFERTSPPPASGAAVFLQVGLGIVLVFVMHALVVLGLFGIAYASEKMGGGEQAVMSVICVFGTWAMGLGVVQLVYVLPAALAASFVRRGIALGMLIGAAITFALQGACYGLWAASMAVMSLLPTLIG